MGGPRCVLIDVAATGSGSVIGTVTETVTGTETGTGTLGSRPSGASSLATVASRRQDLTTTVRRRRITTRLCEWCRTTTRAAPCTTTAGATIRGYVGSRVVDGRLRVRRRTHTCGLWQSQWNHTSPPPSGMLQNPCAVVGERRTPVAAVYERACGGVSARCLFAKRTLESSVPGCRGGYACPGSRCAG